MRELHTAKLCPCGHDCYTVMFGRLDARLCTCRLRRCALASASGTELCAPARSNGVPSAGAGHAEPIADPSAGAGHTEPIASPTVRLDFGAPAQRAEYAMSVLRSAFCGTAQGVQQMYSPLSMEDQQSAINSSSKCP